MVSIDLQYIILNIQIQFTSYTVSLNVQRVHLRWEGLLFRCL
ncbi:hypothetical protein X975_14620, partial [Stegodyphus mimosarum]